MCFLFEISKTDQNRVGCTRTVYATEDDLCPVEAYKMLRRMRGANWKDEQPLFQTNDGTVMSREYIAAVLKAAAVDLGMDAADVATHSLRIGGATAAAASGKVEYEDIRHFGRWKSDCWRRYVYSSRARSRGMATAMSRATYTKEMSARDYANALRSQNAADSG